MVSVSDLSGATNGYTLSQLNLSQIAASAGISLSAGFQLRFQAAVLNALPSQGLAFDNIRVTQLKATGSGQPINEIVGAATGSISSLATFTDGLNPVGNYTATINWGDQTGSTSATATVSNNQIIVSTPGHTYSNGGNYTYTITLTDTTTGRTATETGTANISNVTPRVTDVLVDGASWTSGFLGALQTAGEGNGSGYAIPVGVPRS